MIGADLEGADLESRVVSSLRPHRTLLSRTFRLDFTFRFHDITSQATSGPSGQQARER